MQMTPETLVILAILMQTIAVLILTRPKFKESLGLDTKDLKVVLSLVTTAIILTVVVALVASPQ